MCCCAIIHMDLFNNALSANCYNVGHHCEIYIDALFEDSNNIGTQT